MVAIAPAGYIYQESCAQVVHYRVKASRDFVPRIGIIGAKRAKDTIVDLEHHPDAPIFNHTFDSPTYQELKQKSGSS